MKRLYALLSAIMMAAAIALPSMAGTNHVSNVAVQDTLILKPKNNAKELVVVKDLRDLKSIKDQSLDSLVALLEKHTTEIERAGQGAKDSTVTITVSTDRNGAHEEEVNITISKNTENGKQTVSKTIKNVKIDVETDEENNKTSIKIGSNDDDDDDEEEKKPKPRYPKKEFDFQVDLGTSMLLNQKMLSNNAALPANAITEAKLRPLGSWFVGLNFKTHYRLGGENSPMRLITGVTLDFNSYSFKENVRVDMVEGQTVFQKDAFHSLDKSKFSTTTVTIPLELALHLKNSNRKTNFKIGGGGFVGYMFDGEYNEEYSVNGDERSIETEEDFNLRDFQYGLSGFIGVRSLEFFAKYNLNEMFESGKGPRANTFSVGVRILKL
ncbi:MAG: outer membrane beta-barrel protein [Rufibacter sp.]